jgi:hypothetical protein
MEKQKITIYISQEMMVWLTKLADLQDRSLNSQINHLLATHPSYADHLKLSLY